MSKKKEPTQEQDLEAQANALLAADEAAAEAAETPTEADTAEKAAPEGENAKSAHAAPRLDDKVVASLPAAALIAGNDKLRELLAKGKKKGKLESAELMDTLDDLNLEGDQMDQLYDSLEALNIDISTDEDILPELPEEGPADEEIADVEDEELVDPNSLVSNFSIDDPVRMYLKEIGKVPLLSPDEEIVLAQDMAAGNEAEKKQQEIEKRRRAGETLHMLQRAAFSFEWIYSPFRATTRRRR